MLIFRLIFISFLFVHFNFSQNKSQIDSINNFDYTYISNNLTNCKKLFDSNIYASKKINYKKGEANSYCNLALVYSLLGDYKTTVSLNLKALKILESLKDYAKVAKIYSDIGYRIRYINYDQGVYYFRKAIQIGEKYKIKEALAPVYNNYGETIKNKNLDSALYFYKLSLHFAKNIKDSIGIPFSLNKIAEAFAKKKNFKKAFQYLQESDMYRFAKKDSAGIADNIAYRADIFYEIPIYDSAIFYYEKSLKLAITTKYNSLERFCLERLSTLYQTKNDYKNAYFTYLKFKKLEDSALNIGVKNEMANLEIKFNTEKTKLQLAENQIKLASRQKWLIVSIALLIILLLTLRFVYRYQFTKRQNQIKELELNKEIEKTKLEKDFVNEKFRIARELHDNIGSHLTFIISSLDNLSYLNNPEKRIEKITDLSNFGRLTMKDLRDTIWAMNHDDGNVEQLITRISELRAVLPTSLEVQLELKLDKEIKLNGLQLLNMYRIIQEFIQNTIKYADASKILIIMEQNVYQLSFKMIDNGKGFNLKSIDFGNGILNMKRRCEDLYGKFYIDSNENGTHVECEIPILINTI